MPIVRVEWLEGRSDEQKAALAEKITSAMSEVAGTDPAGVWVLFDDVSPANWAIAGKPQQKPQ